MDQVNIGSMLRQYLKNNNISINQASTMLEMSPSQLQNIIDGKNYGVRFLFTIMNKFKDFNIMNNEVTNTIEESIQKNTSQSVVFEKQEVYDAVKKDRLIHRDKKGIPMIPTSAVAGWSSGDISIMDYDVSELYVVPEFIEAKVDYIITAKGSSMLPKYNSGDKLACRIIRDIQFIQWGKVYVLDSEQGVLVKRLYEGSNKDSIVCHSDNESRYPRFEINKDSIRSISIVIGVIRLE